MPYTASSLRAHLQSRLDTLEASAEFMLEECLALGPSDFRPLYNGGGYGDDFGAFPLRLELWGEDFPDLDLDAQRARCPRTVEVLDAMEGVLLGGFMRLAPYGNIAPHTDRRDDRCVRVFLSLQLPDQEQSWWPLFTTRILDVRNSHRAWNDSERSRHVLCCDFRLDDVLPSGVVDPRWTPDDVELPARFR